MRLDRLSIDCNGENRAIQLMISTQYCSLTTGTSSIDLTQTLTLWGSDF